MTSKHWVRWGRGLLWAVMSVWVAQTGYAAEARHGMSLYGELKYAQGFEAFDYVNPNAPKGGTVKQAAFGTFDSLNPFTLKGVSAAGLSFIYESLTHQSLDEPFSEYGLLAETMQQADDKTWVSFTLRPEAVWHDGQPITVEDVIFSMQTLKKQLPLYRHYFADVIRSEKVGPRTVKFHFKNGDNKELPLIVGQLTVLPKHYWADKDITKSTLTPPLGSGPYKIATLDAGRSITYERVADYWGKDLAVNRGQHNFDQLRYEYYRDFSVAFEAFKAGELDYRRENASKRWATGYDIEPVKQGHVIKEALPDPGTQPMQAFVFNTRKPQFQDPRVREALSYAFDFEWTNKNLFYGAYQRTNSYFLGGGLQSSGVPEGGELALLERYKDQLPEALFTQPFELPQTDASGKIRKNLRQALALLKSAGWVVKNRKLQHAESGQSLDFELLLRDPNMERVALPFKKNLERLGVTMKVRMVDTSQYFKRKENYDFDMMVNVWGQSLSPGNEQRDMWGSAAAKQSGARNYAGIQSAVVDELIETLIAAPTRSALTDATRALDRVLLWGHYVIPQWYAAEYRLAYWNQFSRPEIVPLQSLGFPSTWWYDAEKAATWRDAKAP